MLQLVYISTAVGSPSTAEILAVSRRNNARDDITGLLFADGRRFLQALEGDAIAVERAYARIAADARHRALVLLSRRDVAAREFGEWAMAGQAAGEGAAAMLARIDLLTSNAAPSVKATFDGFARLHR